MAGKKGMRHADRLIKSPSFIERWRAGVRVELIRQRLDKQALGELKTRIKGPNGKMIEVPTEMSKAALKAAELLLARCVPTVSAVEVTGKDGGPVESAVTFYMPKNGRD